MNIAYLTIDEVNEHLAQHIAAEWDLTVYPLSPRDPPADGRYDAVIYDLDSLPPQEQREILTGLLATCPHYPVAVHSHNLDDKAARLRKAGVGVFRQLDRQVFVALYLAWEQVARANGLMRAEKEEKARINGDIPNLGLGKRREFKNGVA